MELLFVVADRSTVFKLIYLHILLSISWYYAVASILKPLFPTTDLLLFHTLLSGPWNLKQHYIQFKCLWRCMYSSHCCPNFDWFNYCITLPCIIIYKTWIFDYLARAAKSTLEWLAKYSGFADVIPHHTVHTELPVWSKKQLVTWKWCKDFSGLFPYASHSTQHWKHRNDQNHSIVIDMNR